MAHGGLDLDRETLSCSICLELLKDPVTIPCGHSYCSGCITLNWDIRRVNSCPQCRKTFKRRPELPKNVKLAALVEKLKKTGVQAAGAEYVACDVCQGRKLKALKSCLVCRVSYCHTHLQPHRDAALLKKHTLVKPSKNLQENICSQHHVVMNMFCRSDQQCICHLCVDEHRGHNIVSAAAERREKQEKLQETQQSIQQRIQDTEGEVKELLQEMKNIKLSADKAVEHSQETNRQLISLMEERSRVVEQQIRSQQEAEVRRVKEVVKKLEQELSELRSKAAKLQQLSLTEDHCRFVRSYSKASLLAGSTHSSSLHLRPCCYFEDMTAAVSESSHKIQQFLRDTWTNISLTYVDVLLSEPKTRAEFLIYSRDITPDPNTAHTQLLLSEGNRRATWTENHQPHPDHPDRFSKYYQVLSRESVTGRCYWEVKVGEGVVRVAVAYKNISRGGDGSSFGHNDKSWALRCHNQSYDFWSNSVMSEVSGPWSSRVGVYLDHPAGLLSFYSVSDSMTLLHTVRTSFTRPLHAGLFVYSSAELVKLK